MKRLFCGIVSFVLAFCFACSVFANENSANSLENVQQPVLEESEDIDVEETDVNQEEKGQQQEKLEDETVLEEEQKEQPKEIVVPKILNVSEKKFL